MQRGKSRTRVPFSRLLRRRFLELPRRMSPGSIRIAQLVESINRPVVRSPGQVAPIDQGGYLLRQPLAFEAFSLDGTEPVGQYLNFVLPVSPSVDVAMPKRVPVTAPCTAADTFADIEHVSCLVYVRVHLRSARLALVRARVHNDAPRGRGRKMDAIVVDRNMHLCALN